MNYWQKNLININKWNWLIALFRLWINLLKEHALKYENYSMIRVVLVGVMATVIYQLFELEKV